MSTDRLERRLPEVLSELALPNMPDYVDDLLGRIERTPQRAGWTFLERWFPVSTITASVPRRSVPVRLVIAIALLLTLLLASVALYAGSRPRTPPLIGPARNGLVVTTDNGSIVSVDPDTGQSATLVAGTDLCCLELAPDGRHVAYAHVPVDGADATGLSVASLDGSTTPRDLPDDLVRGLSWFEWSGAGDRLLVTSSGSVATVDIDTGQVTPITLDDASLKIVSAASIGTSEDILLTTRTSDSAPMHVYRLAAGASSPVEITELAYAVGVPTLSPDGSRFSYFVWGPEDRLHGRIHVFDLATGEDIAITPEDEAANADPHSVEGTIWSPDGSLIASSWYGAGFDQIALLPATGGSPVFVGPKLPENGLSAGAAVHFSPDGESLLVSYGFDDTTWLLPVSGAPGHQVPWTISHVQDGYGWQRLAP